MRNLLIILLSVLSLAAFAQDKKTVAVLDPICRDNSVNPFFQQMVRGAMESAVTASSEYEAYDRSAFDQIQKEQAFQRTGAVNDSQIKKMGELAGVDYVLVSEVSAYEGYLSAVVKILNVTTGKYDKSVDDYTQLNPESVKTKCREMASSLFGVTTSGKKQSTITQTASVETPQTQVKSTTASSASNAINAEGYVDLGLPSGTLWKAQNEPCGLVTHDKAMSLYGNNMPSLEQLAELINSCVWEWTGEGYNVTGQNNQTIFIPTKGKKEGLYWSSTSVDEDTLVFSNLNEAQAAKMKKTIKAMGGYFYCIKITPTSKEVWMQLCNNGMFVRLVR